MTNQIMDWIERVAHIPTDGDGEPPDVCVIELGGTVGDIESAPFVEALRQFQFKVGRDRCAPPAPPPPAPPAARSPFPARPAHTVHAHLPLARRVSADLPGCLAACPPRVRRRL